VPVIQHVAEYDRIINAVKGDVKSKTLAAQFIPPFFGKFADRAEQALNAQLDLVEDENNVVGVVWRHIVCRYSVYFYGADAAATDSSMTVVWAQIRMHAIVGLAEIAKNSPKHVKQIADVLTQLLVAGNHSRNR